MRIVRQPLPGVAVLAPFRQADTRGSFTKTFHAAQFQALGLQTDFRESYYSVSNPGVVRGMHFQLPPHDHAKLVYCAVGAVSDVFIDLRSGETYGQVGTELLSATNGLVLYLPPGFAHGFQVLGAEPAVMVYMTTSEHNPAADDGIRWDTFWHDWPLPVTAVSERDSNFLPFTDFNTPW